MHDVLNTHCILLRIAQQRNAMCDMLYNLMLTRSMSTGAIDALAEDPDTDISQAVVLRKLEPSITAALKAYHTRATQCGRSFEHVVLLEAAAQGWYLPAMTLFSPA